MRQTLRYLYERAPIPGRLEDGSGNGGHGEIRPCAVYAIPQHGGAMLSIRSARAFDGEVLCAVCPDASTSAAAVR